MSVAFSTSYMPNAGIYLESIAGLLTYLLVDEKNISQLTFNLMRCMFRNACKR